MSARQASGVLTLCLLGRLQGAAGLGASQGLHDLPSPPNSINCGISVVQALVLAVEDAQALQRACTCGELLGRLIGAQLLTEHLLIGLHAVVYHPMTQGCWTSRARMLLVRHPLAACKSQLQCAQVYLQATLVHAAADGVFDVRQSLVKLGEQPVNAALQAAAGRERAQVSLSLPEQCWWALHALANALWLHAQLQRVKLAQLPDRSVVPLNYIAATCP